MKTTKSRSDFDLVSDLIGKVVQVTWEENPEDVISQHVFSLKPPYLYYDYGQVLRDEDEYLEMATHTSSQELRPSFADVTKIPRSKIREIKILIEGEDVT